jgi:hypothetical protein
MDQVDREGNASEENKGTVGEDMAKERGVMD